MADQAEVRNIIKAELARRLDTVKIVAVNLTPQTDHDGSRALFINVVYDGKQEQLDVGQTTSMVRHIRPLLEEAGETAFPVFTYIAKSDLGNRSPEAA